MSATGTRTAEYTITDARHVGAKIGADLRILHNMYGSPPLAQIDDFVEEVALLLREGYLGTVSYGFRDPSTNAWKLRLLYRATVGGGLTDGRPGSLPQAATIAGTTWYSYLTYSTKFNNLSPTDRAKFKASLPITRTNGEEPSARSGSTISGNGYARNGVGVTKEIYTAP